MYPPFSVPIVVTLSQASTTANSPRTKVAGAGEKVAPPSVELANWSPDAVNAGGYHGDGIPGSVRAS